MALVSSSDIVIYIFTTSVQIISPNLQLNLNNAIRWVDTNVDKDLEWKMKTFDFLHV